jgi:hypothetical protein
MTTYLSYLYNIGSAKMRIIWEFLSKLVGRNAGSEDSTNTHLLSGYITVILIKYFIIYSISLHNRENRTMPSEIQEKKKNTI